MQFTTSFKTRTNKSKGKYENNKIIKSETKKK